MENNKIDITGVNYNLELTKQSARLTGDILANLKQLSDKVQLEKSDAQALKTAIGLLSYETSRVIDMLLMLNDTAFERVDAALEELSVGKEV